MAQIRANCWLFSFDFCHTIFAMWKKLPLFPEESSATLAALLGCAWAQWCSELNANASILMLVMLVIVPMFSTSSWWMCEIFQSGTKWWTDRAMLFAWQVTFYIQDHIWIEVKDERWAQTLNKSLAETCKVKRISLTNGKWLNDYDLMYCES